MSLINVTALGTDLLKTGGCDGCADASAVSEQQVTGNGLVEFTAPEAGTLRFVGLGSGGIGTAAGDIQFALRLQGGVVEVRESGAYRTETAFGAGDVFRITLDGGLVRYWKNGAVVFTSGTPASSPMRLHVLMFNAGAALGGLMVTTGASAASSTPAGAAATAEQSPVRFAVPRPAGQLPKRR